MDTNKTFWTSPLFRNLVIALAALLVVLVAAKAIAEIKSIRYIGSGTPVTNAITVNGKGEVLATPDIATFSFGVSEEAPSVPEAQKAATEKMNAILAYVKTAGVEEKDVKTVSYNIYPRYEWRGATAYQSGKQVLAAYVVSQNIEVKVRNLDNAGTLLSGIGEYGATDVSGLNFTLDDQDALQREARDQAIVDAREQAEVLAKALGVKLGRMTGYYENAPYQPYPMYFAKDAMGGAAMERSVATAPSVPSGENKIVSNVSVTYEIK